MVIHLSQYQQADSFFTPFSASENLQHRQQLWQTNSSFYSTIYLPVFPQNFDKIWHLYIHDVIMIYVANKGGFRPQDTTDFQIKFLFDNQRSEAIDNFINFSGINMRYSGRECNIFDGFCQVFEGSKTYEANGKTTSRLYSPFLIFQRFQRKIFGKNRVYNFRFYLRLCQMSVFRVYVKGVCIYSCWSMRLLMHSVAITAHTNRRRGQSDVQSPANLRIHQRYSKRQQIHVHTRLMH